jgi:hypothetical protein
MVKQHSTATKAREIYFIDKSSIGENCGFIRKSPYFVDESLSLLALVRDFQRV